MSKAAFLSILRHKTGQHPGQKKDQIQLPEQLLTAARMDSDGVLGLLQTTMQGLTPDQIEHNGDSSISWPVAGSTESTGGALLSQADIPAKDH